MLFNSIQFGIFLPVIFSAYWLIDRGKFRLQNLLLLFASYFFYASWDYRFLFLLIFSTLLDFFTGLKMESASNAIQKRCWYILSISINLGCLGIFKYYNFFASSFAEALGAVGFHANFWTLSVILPVGISFYTFHGLSYVIDIYNNKIKAEKSFVDYALFVSFFPLLVAGPVERATHLLPQIKEKRIFDSTKAIDGLRQILWGLFKKIVIADNCAAYVDVVFGNYHHEAGSTLVLGIMLFAIQIYCDFSGYSDIAIGTARLFGIELLRNFAYPYFSRNIGEFWERWNISLSTWFRDYLYIPLGGNRVGKWIRIRNTFIIFLASGFWHGASLTFIIWAMLNAVYTIPLLFLKRDKNRTEIVAQGRYLPSIKEFFSMALTFSLASVAGIFFRSPNVSTAIEYIAKIFSGSIFSMPLLPGKKFMLLVIVFMVIEWLGREQIFPIAKLGFNWPRPARLIMYYAIVLLIIFFSESRQQFIYFQF
jgi:D-alanyl-lipoteichoic acid acyltransferase DltB (MBOAT superfamily)